MCTGTVLIVIGKWQTPRGKEILSMTEVRHGSHGKSSRQGKPPMQVPHHRKVGDLREGKSTKETKLWRVVIPQAGSSERLPWGAEMGRLGKEVTSFQGSVLTTAVWSPDLRLQEKPLSFWLVSLWQHLSLRRFTWPWISDHPASRSLQV